MGWQCGASLCFSFHFLPFNNDVCQLCSRTPLGEDLRSIVRFAEVQDGFEC